MWLGREAKPPWAFSAMSIDDAARRDYATGWLSVRETCTAGAYMYKDAVAGGDPWS